MSTGEEESTGSASGDIKPERESGRHQAGECQQHRQQDGGQRQHNIASRAGSSQRAAEAVEAGEAAEVACDTENRR